MIKIVAHCQFSGGTSTKPGTVVETVKLVPVQDPKGANAAVFDGGVGGGSFDLSRVTEAVRAQFKPGCLVEVTFRPIEA